jgi:ElaB/YqjD/DUF883 family membrane-anchored ribosome-binding protein
MASSYEKDVDALKADLKHLRADVTELSEAIRNLAVDQSKEGYARIRGRAEGYYDQAAEKANEFSHQIEDRPLTSVLAAVGIGFIIGAIFS